VRGGALRPRRLLGRRLIYLLGSVLVHPVVCWVLTPVWSGCFHPFTYTVQ
jgi:hypothetical protein